jgi:hypothetical protein
VCKNTKYKLNIIQTCRPKYHILLGNILGADIGSCGGVGAAAADVWFGTGLGLGSSVEEGLGTVEGGCLLVEVVLAAAVGLGMVPATWDLSDVLGGAGAFQGAEEFCSCAAVLGSG